MKLPAFFLVSALSAPWAPLARAGTPAADQAAADALCAATTLAPSFDYAAAFSANFRAAVGYEQVQQTLASLARTFGPCASATPTALATAGGARIAIRLHTAADGKVDGFLITEADDPRLAARDWAGFAAAMDHLPGQTSAYLTPELNVRAELPLAIGSVFKLWVLGTLWGRIAPGDPAWTWDSVREVREEWKSFPSGDLHLAPAGTQITLLELAHKMIMQSDNTATDHLIHALGRDEIAATAVAMGRTATATLPASVPFLTTAEFFKLKWARTDNQADAYAAAGPEERRAILAKLVDVPRADVCLTADCFAAPTHIDSIEFLATTRETCAAMDWLTRKNDAAVDAVLASNVPFIITGPGSHWAWAGFKGGSEPGVYHYVFGLRSFSGKTGCFSFAWNDANAPAGDFASTGTRLALQAVVRAGLALAAAAID